MIGCLVLNNYPEQHFITQSTSDAIICGLYNVLPYMLYANVQKFEVGIIFLKIL